MSPWGLRYCQPAWFGAGSSGAWSTPLHKWSGAGEIVFRIDHTRKEKTTTVTCNHQQHSHPTPLGMPPSITTQLELHLSKAGRSKTVVSAENTRTFPRLSEPGAASWLAAWLQLLAVPMKAQKYGCRSLAAASGSRER
jgi:hypothetical protein